MKPMFPSVAAYSSLILMSPKRFRNSVQTSVLSPLPMAILTLWFFSFSFCKTDADFSWSAQQRLTDAAGASSGDLLYLWHVAEIAQRLADVLHHRYIVFPAVVPELRGGKLSPKNDGISWKNSKLVRQILSIKVYFCFFHPLVVPSVLDYFTICADNLPLKYFLLGQFLISIFLVQPQLLFAFQYTKP